MKSKLILTALMILVLGLLIFAINQYHEKKVCQEAVGNAIYLISNNENYQLEKFRNAVKNDNCEMAISKTTSITTDDYMNQFK